MIARVLPPNPTLADRFGHLLYWLFEGVALDWRRRGVTHVHALEISLRVHGLWKRVHRVLEAWRAGRLRVAVRRVTPPLSPPSRGGGRKTRSVCAWGVLPRRFGWLKSLFSLESVYHVNAFYPLIHEDAEMQAVIAAAPGPSGRALRPFCHLLGLPVPEALRLPKRARDPGLRRRRAAAASRLRDERSELIIPNRRLPPREQVEDAVRRSETYGKPIDVKKFTPAAYGQFVHPPRDGNCPPVEIGYGGRRRPPPKDYKPPPPDDE